MTERPTYEELEQRVKKLETAVVKHEKTESNWDVFFDCTTDMLCVISFDKKFKQVNPAWHKTLGWLEEELLDRCNRTIRIRIKYQKQGNTHLL